MRGDCSLEVGLEVAQVGLGMARFGQWAEGEVGGRGIDIGLALGFEILSFPPFFTGLKMQ